MPDTYDYIIVGAGSAGCVIANRLTENLDVSVLLLEAGPRDNSLKLKVPAAFIYNYTSPQHNWTYHTEPEPQLDGRRIFCPRGKVLGGSSSINGMAFVRGQVQDFDGWAEKSLPSWSYAHCLPYFRRMETYSGGEDECRGGSGPLHIRRPEHRHPLYDYFLEAVQQECTRPISVNPEISLFNRAKNGARWLISKDGPAATNQSEIAGYVRSTSSDRPDLQICFMPLAINYEKMKPISPHGFLLFAMPLRPDSSGHVKLKSANPFDAPAILCNYLATERDRQEQRDVVTICRNIIAQKAFDPIRGREIDPGNHARSNAEIDSFIINHGKPTHHLCGSCKMGVDDKAVVDESLRVYGIEALRVADASIMPSITSGNTNAPAIMIGEKASDLFADRVPEKSIEVAIYRGLDSSSDRQAAK